ncbi:MAG: PQQ-binding-like beta-propeller repeat protein, partial [Pirellulaceae bacterium]|nr:PQQ-binding-like beta-propeller repeat protein [Pirellulaceae bacterium]
MTKQFVATSTRLVVTTVQITVVSFLLTFFVMNSADPILATEPVTDSGTANDWPQWRGPTRDGVVVGFSIPEIWPTSLDEQWSVEVGAGYSSPVVANGLVYQLSREEDEEQVRCLELQTGKTIWHASYPASGGVHRAAAAHGIGPKSTPVIA